MNTWTRIGLVVLRFVIGWHFLFEGLDKLETTWNYRGKLLFPAAESALLTRMFGERKDLTDKVPFSAAGYLRESQGPLADYFRREGGNPDEELSDYFNLSGDREPQTSREKVWKAQLDALVQHYQVGQHKAVQPEYVGMLAVVPTAPFPAAVPWPALRRGTLAPPDKLQADLIAEDFRLANAKAVSWIQRGERDVPVLPSAVTVGGPDKKKETTQERIIQYRLKLWELHKIESEGMPAFEQEIWKEKYRTLKKDIAKDRTELLRDLDKPYESALSVAQARLSKAQRELGPPELETPTTHLDWINFLTRWGLTLVGAFLIIGLFTRSSCVAGAAFLLIFYLAMPSLPWVPDNPRAEGHYYYINKNIIELVALLMLATTQSGKWVGVDGFVQFLNPFRWRHKAAAKAQPRPRPQPVS
jgi:uncharacterized membrane protein YphA (DoxX/SURF4 family)